MVGGGARAAVILLAVGFLGGFCLSSGSARLLFHAAGQATPQAGGPGEANAADQKGKAGRQAGASTREGKGAGERGGGQEGKADASGQKSGTDQDGDDAAAQAAAALSDASQAGITSFLAGNTMRATGAEGHDLIRYMSDKGWQGEPQRGGLLAHRWMARDNRLCLVVASGSVACQTVTIRREPRPGDQRGALLGTLSVKDGPRWTVSRGNGAGMPETIPLIGGELASSPDATTAKPSAIGEAAIKALVGRTLLATGQPAALSGERFEADGRWLDAGPIEPGARDGLGGVRVRIGTWLARDGLLCVDQPGLDLTRLCYRPEQWGDATFRLRTDRAATLKTMVTAAAL